MQAYIISVAAAAVMAALADILIPKGWQKYIAVLTGAVLLISLTSPLLKLGTGSLPELDFPDAEYTEFDIDGEIDSAFCRKIETDIIERLKYEFSLSCDVSVNAVKSEGVLEIKLNCAENSAVAARLREVYGCGNIKFTGGGAND